MYKHIGWICRVWIESSKGTWRSFIKRFPSFEKADAFGRQEMKKALQGDEFSKEFEIYKDFERS